MFENFVGLLLEVLENLLKPQVKLFVVTLALAKKYALVIMHADLYIKLNSV